MHIVIGQPALPDVGNECCRNPDNWEPAGDPARTPVGGWFYRQGLHWWNTMRCYRCGSPVEARLYTVYPMAGIPAGSLDEMSE